MKFDVLAKWVRMTPSWRLNAVSFDPGVGRRMRVETASLRVKNKCYLFL
jgi:hypothetical protein